MPSLLDVPETMQLHAERFAEISRWHGTLGWFLRSAASWGAIGPEMMLTIAHDEWPAFLTPDHRYWRWLYLARCSAAGLVKIGISERPLLRLQSLRQERKTATPFDLVAVLPFCGLEHERFLCGLMADSLESGREWFKDTVATRLLCWCFAAHRSPHGVQYERYRQGREIEALAVGLRYVCAGIIPKHTHGLNAVSCSVCGSRRHIRTNCPERRAA